MHEPSASSSATLDTVPLLDRFRQIRSFTEFLCEPLETEDYVVQTMPDVSPTKWHLAHTSWFFETFILRQWKKDYKAFNPLFAYLYNSYYVQVGERFHRPSRGLLSRPTVREVYAYRSYIDEHVAELLDSANEDFLEKLHPVFEIGLQHEQQHQELLLTDIKHVLSFNPLKPEYRAFREESNGEHRALNWIALQSDVYEIGHAGKAFCFDNELPRHRTFIQPAELASRLLTNEEYLAFMNDGGYERTPLWLSEGSAFIEANGIRAPLYWEKIGDDWYSYTLRGCNPIGPAEPVCHVSFFEADAYARWAGARLATEFEWEIASIGVEPSGNFVEGERYHPSSTFDNSDGLNQMYGDVWEWTGSAYLPYPGYKPDEGALGEYNGKFMSSQMVLRGGSCATSKTHIRNTYRNFFPPNARWQFSGIRLARDVR